MNRTKPTNDGPCMVNGRGGSGSNRGLFGACACSNNHHTIGAQ
jgi:hypothetical protein